MTYQINYLVGNRIAYNPKLRRAPINLIANRSRNTEHQADIEAIDARAALNSFRTANPEAKIYACIKKILPSINCTG